VDTGGSFSRVTKSENKAYEQAGPSVHASDIREVPDSKLMCGTVILRFFVVLLSLSQPIPGQYLETNHDHFLYNPMAITIRS
jgi:hypothetical protein